MRPATKLLKQVRRGVRSAAYGNPIYQKILASGDAPNALRFTPPDLWPGEARAGLVLIAEQRSLFDNAGAVARRDMTDIIRGLRAAGTDAARLMALRMIEQWLTSYDNWHETEWAPGALGERIASWIGFYEFYAPAASTDFIENLTASLSRQWKHLMRAIPLSLSGLECMQAIKGLVYGGLNFPGGERAIGLGLDLLRRQLSAEVLPDGGHISRSPYVQLHMLRHLIDLRVALHAAGFDVAGEIQTSIAAMVPALKFFLHGDGGLALFHGGCEETPLLVESVFTHSGVRSRAVRRLPKTGYERLVAGRSLLIADTARPAPRGYDDLAHAGLMSFEFGIGRERLIVNCGTHHGGSAEWRAACASTAAHSTLTIEDTNACDLPGGSAALRVDVQRYEENGAHCIDMVHDGYQRRFGMSHRRLLRLSSAGDELLGREDMLAGQGHGFALRWHLHPSVQALLSQDNHGALLRTASGSGWRLKVDGLPLILEPSVYCGQGTPRRSLQLKTGGRTHGDPTTITWSLTREKRG